MDGRRGGYRDVQQKWRSFRWPVNLGVSLQEHGSCTLAVKMLELSTTGCRLLTGYRVPPGKPVLVHVSDFRPFRGAIVWCENWQVAVRFAEPLHLSVVHHVCGMSEGERGVPPSPFDHTLPDSVKLKSIYKTELR